ncbi:MAG: DUF2490 domain-containing protein [Leeuwenhoekiella sp.]
MKKKYLFYALIFVISSATFAQEKTVKKSNQQWLGYYTQLKLNEKWAVLTDFQYRWKDGFDQSAQFIIRSQASYKLDENLTVGAGFGYVGFYTDNDISRYEYRPYQEGVLKGKLLSLNFTQRLRLEERFFHLKATAQNTFNFRFRYRLLTTIPIAKLSAKNLDFLLELSLGDEIFINAGKDVVTNIFDQNRFLIVPSVQVNKDLTITLVYNSQFGSTSMPDVFNQTNILWLTARHNLNFLAKKKSA